MGQPEPDGEPKSREDPLVINGRHTPEEPSAERKPERNDKESEGGGEQAAWQGECNCMECAECSGPAVRSSFISRLLMMLLWFLLLRGSCFHPPHLPWWCGPSLGQEVLKLIQLIRLAPPGASATIWLTQALQPPQG
ncbi:hypothetical protein Q5P01_025387 [Channa striata]|uniref:Uncharacterized protein n=1 Tax=Channa striata TaxID=64152 RepID=A0AA88IPH6_CHASR|nr:hypothetical protein Q5P01_025387 [Channa striata]